MMVINFIIIKDDIDDHAHDHHIQECHNEYNNDDTKQDFHTHVS